MRNKVSREVKAEAIRLYMDGLSLRVIARKFQVSKESVRQWILKFEEAFAGKEVAERKGTDKSFCWTRPSSRGTEDWCTSPHALISNGERSFQRSA